MPIPDPRILAFATLLLAGCSKGGDTSALGSATIDTLPGGVVHVTNSGPTEWPDTNGWRIVLERTIAPPDGSPGEIGAMQSIVAGANGDIYLLQNEPMLIKSYSADGKWLRDIGREGDGPGEFHAGMFTIAAGVLVIQDPNHTRMTTISTDGRPIASITSQCCWWTGRFPVFADTTLGITGPAPKGFEDHEGALYLTRLDGSVVDTVLMPVRKESDSHVEPGTWVVTRIRPGGKSTRAVEIPLYAANRQFFLPQRQKVVGNTAAYSLAIVSLKGDTVRTFSAPAINLPVSDAERDSLFDATVNGVQPTWRDAMLEVVKKSDIPNTRPAWSDVMVDGTSHIWVLRPGSTRGVAVFDVFSPEGILLGAVPTTEGEALMSAYWTADHIYQRGETADGSPAIKVYKIVKK